MKSLTALLLACALLPLPTLAAGWADGQPGYSQAYDPARNPLNDLSGARLKASMEKKKILLFIGGEWCRWCKEMNRFLDADPHLAKAFTDTFVVIKVNVSDENKNTHFLSVYPEFQGVPHFFILDKNGTLIESVNTGLLEQGDSYSRDKFVRFVDYFAKW
ncbi:thiol-disulfide isomerase [Aeromonas schubertii]|uniref:thioredoxin family protein n=1 Tax=Aeromonas schubertii TaxID=652 RepID=UPI00067F3667|nr:thioredoxin family protein [Aeromonas schubertii]KUE81468.1 thiol-disulfide isomerase [Aeromonas schubertii]